MPAACYIQLPAFLLADSRPRHQKSRAVAMQNTPLSMEPRTGKPETGQAALLIALIRDAVTDDFRT